MSHSPLRVPTLSPIPGSEATSNYSDVDVMIASTDSLLSGPSPTPGPEELQSDEEHAENVAVVFSEDSTPIPILISSNPSSRRSSRHFEEEAANSVTTKIHDMAVAEGRLSSLAESGYERISSLEAAESKRFTEKPIEPKSSPGKANGHTPNTPTSASTTNSASTAKTPISNTTTPPSTLSSHSAIQSTPLSSRSMQSSTSQSAANTASSIGSTISKAPAAAASALQRATAERQPTLTSGEMPTTLLDDVPETPQKRDRHKSYGLRPENMHFVYAAVGAAALVVGGVLVVRYVRGQR